MLRAISFRLVPGFPPLLKADFWVPCPSLVLGRYRCQGRAEVLGLHIGEQSGPRSIRIEKPTVRPRCVECLRRIRITQTEWDQLLGEAKNFFASERLQRASVA